MLLTIFLLDSLNRVNLSVSCAYHICLNAVPLHVLRIV